MKTYVVGPPSSGKTGRLVERLVALIEANTRPDRILVLVPQQSQAQRFRDALATINGAFKPRGQPEISTFYGLAQRHVGLFFPLIAERAGFGGVGEPTYLNVEATQYFLNRIVEPRKYDFEDLRLRRPRLLSQLIDNLNKAAIAGFELTDIAPRLASSWAGEEQRLVSYQRAQEIAVEFRRFCLAHNALDFSLLMDTFARHLLADRSYRDYAAARYRHILADNIEENPPVMHDFVAQLLDTCESAMLVQDEPGGYRIFLGADAEHARSLADLCDAREVAESPREHSPAVAFARAVGATLTRAAPNRDDLEQARAALVRPPIAGKYWANMVRGVADEIAALVADGVSPDRIAVLAPFVEDVLRFELEEHLRPATIGVRPLRPSRPLFDHPVARGWVALAKLAHPEWELDVTAGELARALSVGIADLDIARAQLLAEAAMRAAPRTLAVVEDQAVWSRIGMRFYERYERLRRWLADWQTARASLAVPLDLFWQQLFTDVMSQPGMGYALRNEGAQVADKLARAARAFREVVESVERSASGEVSPAPDDVGKAFVELLAEGIMAAQERVSPPADADETRNVLLAPIFAFLTNDLRAEFQFWLDVNSLGWYQRIYQPLTHPYVLARRWNARTEKWDDEREHTANADMLRRVLLGLAYRCERGVFLASSQLSITGQEDDGPLARAAQKVIV